MLLLLRLPDRYPCRQLAVEIFLKNKLHSPTKPEIERNSSSLRNSPGACSGLATSQTYSKQLREYYSTICLFLPIDSTGGVQTLEEPSQVVSGREMSCDQETESGISADCLP